MDERKIDEVDEPIEKKYRNFLLKKEYTNIEIMIYLAGTVFAASYLGYVLGRCAPLLFSFMR